jgi:hypothetical protein
MPQEAAGRSAAAGAPPYPPAPPLEYRRRGRRTQSSRRRSTRRSGGGRREARQSTCRWSCRRRGTRSGRTRRWLRLRSRPCPTRAPSSRTGNGPGMFKYRIVMNRKYNQIQHVKVIRKKNNKNISTWQKKKNI